MPIKTAFYESADPMAAAYVSLCIIRILYLPRRHCSAATVWNHRELGVQNTICDRYGNKNRGVRVGRPNDVSVCLIMHHTDPVSTPSSLFSGHCLEPLGT